MVRILQPCIGDVWEHIEGGVYTVVGFGRHFGSGREFVICEGEDGTRLWPRDSWLHHVPYHGADATPGAMARPFTLVRQGLQPRTPTLLPRAGDCP
jgi:hypothetical protein